MHELLDWLQVVLLDRVGVIVLNTASTQRVQKGPYLACGQSGHMQCQALISWLSQQHLLNDSVATALLI